MKKNGQKGFSLMEVLVTIGLIAVISGISIPSYRNYIRVSKTAEAQSSLGQVYMAEKSFFLQHRFYTTDLLTIGVAPDGEMLYNVGFGADKVSDTTDKPGTYLPDLNPNTHNFWKLCGDNFGNDGDCGDDDKGCIASCAFQNPKLKDTANLKGVFIPPDIPAAATTTCASCTPPDPAGHTFRAYAIADLINKQPKNPGNITDKDIWCINEYKQVVRVHDGTKAGIDHTGDGNCNP